MIEVLVTLVVVSVGLLGLAGLQNVSLKNTYSSYLMTNASNMAYDLSDRMRANRTAALGGRYNRNFGDGMPNIGGVAGNDLTAWLNAIQNTLPEGDGAVTVGPEGTALIQIRWLDNRPDGDDPQGDDTTTLTVRTQI